MLFNSIQFIYFFLSVTTLFYLSPEKYRWVILLLASCYFYMAFKPIYILILGFTILIDFYAGIEIEKAKGRKRKLFLLLSLFANIGVLAAFKYFNFLNDNISSVLGFFGYKNIIPDLAILLPIGLSFHTFQAMSYTIEVYRGNFKAETQFGIYSLYVMFYPQLVAGPIERPQNMIHQFFEKHTFTYSNVTNGLRLMAWGFFKKLVISDRIAAVVAQVYRNPHSFKGLILIVVTFFFAIQIYCDFSGYSDIAIGAARTLGFHLMENFNRPYFSASISEFWQKWHISLSTWFRDYLYIPLGGNRVNIWRRYYNLLITFLISGLWHGANWTFIVWGALNGAYQIADIGFKRLFGKTLNTLPVHLLPVVKLVGIVSTFFLVSTTWIFFRAESIDDALYILRNFFESSVGLHELITSQNVIDVAFFLFGLTFLIYHEINQRNLSFLTYLNNKSKSKRWSFYYLLIMIILVFGKFDSNTRFIYFQF